MYLKAARGQFLIIGVIFLFLFKVEVGSTLDYCAKEMCPNQGVHIRCNNDGKFSTDCTGQYTLEDLSPYIDLILNEHNTYRNIIAGGDLACFYPAIKMPLLLWDWDLADNAAFNARTCVFAHDKCRSTTKFMYAGQNIYYAKTKNLKTTIAKFIEEAIFLWFEEYLDADSKLMASVHKTVPQTGHFTVLMNDHQDHVGCACLSNIPDVMPKKRIIIFVCNYSSTNAKGKPAYKAGPAASACQRRNARFKYLCEDEIDPNDIK